MAKKNTKKKTTDIKINDWVIDKKKDGRVIIVYAVKSRGEIITGVAKYNPDDVYDENVGKQLAYKRCILTQRQRDLALCQTYIAAQEAICELVEEEEYIVSRNFQRALQLGYNERKIQWENINRMKKEINELLNHGIVPADDVEKGAE